MVADAHVQLSASVHGHSPSPALLKAWKLIKSRERFITPEQIASTTQIKHDVAEAYLQAWFRHGVLERSPRYPSYVYQRSRDWHQKNLAQQLNRLT
jgi:hypothetical protein